MPQWFGWTLLLIGLLLGPVAFLGEEVTHTLMWDPGDTAWILPHVMETANGWFVAGLPLIVFGNLILIGHSQLDRLKRNGEAANPATLDCVEGHQ